MEVTSQWRRAITMPRLITALTFLGAVLYLVQAIAYAHTQLSLLDEGAYLNKGYLFATGRYSPYQDYGPWTNHMPFAFLLPGWAQLVFGPGLRTGRGMAVLLGTLTVLGLWVLARRVGGEKWGALAVWAIALNPAVIKLYSLANSQALIAAMLVWTVVLVLGEERPSWQILSGSALAGILVMTRVNMAPVLILLVLYLLWQHGWRMAISASLAGGIPILIGHALYWPGILRIWAHWLPLNLFTFLRPWGHPGGSDPSWNPAVTLDMRVTSFFHGIRFHFLALTGALSAWLVWPGRKGWKTTGRFKAAVFLSVLLLVMVLSHLWAALGNNYCVYCYPVYLSFFSGLGLVVLALVVSSTDRLGGFAPTALVTVAILVIAGGVGFSTFGDLGARLISGDLVRATLAIQVPRVSAWRILPGEVALWGLVSNRLGLNYVQVVQRASLWIQMAAMTALGLVAGGAILLGARWVYRRVENRDGLRKFWRSSPSLGAIALGITLLAGFVLSPTEVLGGGYDTYDCGGDVIRSYETAGAHLAEQIPPGSRVYWEGGNSSVPLLYVHDIDIFPAQLNGDYSYRLGGDPDALARYGFWSEELAHRWAQEADIILIEERNYHGWLRDLVESGGYDELAPTQPLLVCRDNSSIHIFHKQG